MINTNNLEFIQNSAVPFIFNKQSRMAGASMLHKTANILPISLTNPKCRPKVIFLVISQLVVISFHV